MLQRREAWVLLAALTAVSLTECSSAPPEKTEARAGAGASEAERVRAYLDARYRSSDVRHSFRTELGQTVDCVDFFATPGVRAMAARGEPVAAIPEPPAAREHRRRDGSVVVVPSQPAPAPEGVDADGHARICPPGTVTQFRITEDDIARAGGLDAYQAALHKHAPARIPARARAGALPPQGSMWPCETGDFVDYAHVIGDVVDNVPGIVFAETTMSVNAPAVPKAGDHSVAQEWLFDGTGAEDLPGASCPADPVQSIEVGWGVGIPGGDQTSPHLFIFSTTNGYCTLPQGGGSGCWNGGGGGNCPFVPAAQVPPQFTPGAALPHSPPGAAPAELSALIIQIGGNYWVQVGVNGQRYYIGYYPGSSFAKPLSTYQVGGETADGNDSFLASGLQMGSGLTPSDGYPWAAYHHDFDAEVWVNGVSSNYYGAQSMCASFPPGYPGALPPYAYSTAPAPGAATWNGYFYYGGTPPTQCQPQTCAGAGATCGSISTLCGGTQSCGTCSAPYTCQSNTCQCQPVRCRTGFEQDPDTCKCVKVIGCHGHLCQ